MRFKVSLLRYRGHRLPWRDVNNGPKYTGELLTHRISVAGAIYTVATLRPADPIAAALVPHLYEPVLIGFAPLGF